MKKNKQESGLPPCRTKVFFALLLLCILVLSPRTAAAKNLRFSLTGGFNCANELQPSSTFNYGAGIHLAYPVSSRAYPVNTEISVANWFNRFEGINDYMHLFRFGIGIRIFLNTFKGFRPYFTHDITSHVIWQSEKNGYAATFGILLGLGIDLPVSSPGTDGKASSFFLDVSFNTFTLAYFSLPVFKTSFFAAAAGYSWELPF